MAPNGSEPLISNGIKNKETENQEEQTKNGEAKQTGNKKTKTSFPKIKNPTYC